MERFLKIKELDIARLNNYEYISFMSRVIAFIPPSQSRHNGEHNPALIGVPQELYERFVKEVDHLQYDSDLTVMGDEIRVTTEVPVRDDRIDKLVCYIWTRVVTVAKLSLEKERKAGLALMPVITPFADFSQKPMSEGVTIIDKVLKNLEVEIYAPHLALLGLNGYLAELKRGNEAYKAKVLQRQREISLLKQKESSVLIRKRIDEIYADFTLITQSYSAIKPSEVSRKYIFILNELVTQMGALLKRRDTLRRKKEERLRAIANGEPLPPPKPRKKTRRRRRRY